MLDGPNDLDVLPEGEDTTEGGDSDDGDDAGDEEGDEGDED